MRLALRGLAVRHPSAPASGAGSSPVLQPLTLAIESGEQVAVVGPSGAGKTTLLHALACALKPAAGGFDLDATDPWSLPIGELQKLRGRLFLAPQAPPLPPRQRVITAVLAARLPQQSLAASLRSLFYPTQIAQAEAALARFDLADKLWERVDRLSGGERQRVGLARALVSAARLWLVDEPLSSLDPSRAALVIDTLTSAARERGVTLVVSLHQVDVATRFQRVLGMREGVLQFDLPGAAVDGERLAALYAQSELGLAAPSDAPVDTYAQGPRPAALHCR